MHLICPTVGIGAINTVAYIASIYSYVTDQQNEQNIDSW